MPDSESLKHGIATAIAGNVIDIIYAGEQEIYTVLTHHCATFSVWSGPLSTVLYLALTAKTLGTPALQRVAFTHPPSFLINFAN